MQRQNNFDPKLLAPEFDPAIVALFEHENVGDQPALPMIMTAYSQYNDLFQAYLYAKEEVLPFIRANGKEAITPKLVLAWLNQAHGKIASALAEASHFTAGQYTDRQTLRWHWGMMTHDVVGSFLAGANNGREILKLALENGMDKQQGQKIIRLLEKIRDMKEAKRHIENLKKRAMTPRNVDQHVDGNAKLSYVYHHKLLSPADLITLSELVVVCLEPELYPKVMNEFAIGFVREWKLCDGSNPEQLSNLLLNAYRGIAGIHPYTNGNGRTATWLLNLICRTFDLPSFLMREPGERFNAKSSYGEAIKHIDTNPELFKNHVLQRINVAREQGPTECHIQYLTVMKRFEVLTLIRKILSEHRDFNLSPCAEKILAFVEVQMIQEYGHERCLAQEPVILFTASSLELACFEQILADIVAKPVAVSKLQSVTGCEYSADEINEIKRILQALTGVDNWLHYKKGTIMHLQLNDNELADKIIDILNHTGGAVVAEKKKLLGKETLVVQLTNINLKKLAAHYAVMPEDANAVAKTGTHGKVNLK